LWSHIAGGGIGIGGNGGIGGIGISYIYIKNIY
jgi:hypothetical protein